MATKHTTRLWLAHEPEDENSNYMVLCSEPPRLIRKSGVVDVTGMRVAEVYWGPGDLGIPEGHYARVEISVRVLPSTTYKMKTT